MPRGQRQVELNTGDMKIPQPPVITMPDLDEDFERPSTSIASVSDMPNQDYLDELKFNEDILTIRLERSSEKYAPKQVLVGNNGQMLWLDVGVPIKIARKFVESLAGSMPTDVRTEVLDRESENPRNEVIRTTRAQHPFSVLHDPSPKGNAWLTWILNRG